MKGFICDIPRKETIEMSESIYDEMTASEMIAKMTRGGYEVKTSHNWILGKFELRVSNGKAGCVYYIPIDEIDDQRIKNYLEDSISRIHDMKGEK